MRTANLRIGMLAGEASGDNLGAGLMRALQTRYPGKIDFVGVGGQKMAQLRLRALVEFDELSVNGFRDPVVKLVPLIRTFRSLVNALSAENLDVFVGIDFNVFNFLLEGALKKRGIKTVHYVSPSVYAWRRGRAKKVANVAQMILCLFPFEPKFYKGTDIETVFVGHPLADAIDENAGSQLARLQSRQALGLAPDKTVLAVLPGSRPGELRLMLPEFLRAAEIFSQGQDTEVVIPCLRPDLAQLVERAIKDYRALNVTIHSGVATQALTACDIALVKSGTSTLETMLLHRPMVVSYRMGHVSYQLAKRLMKSAYVALPNILAARMLVPELLQYAATGESLAAALHQELHLSRTRADYFQPFLALHKQLRQQADLSAAKAVLGLLGVGNR